MSGKQFEQYLEAGYGPLTYFYFDELFDPDANGKIKAYDLTEEDLKELFRAGPKHFNDRYHVERYDKTLFRAFVAYRPNLDDFIALLSTLASVHPNLDEDDPSLGIRLNDFINCAINVTDILFNLDYEFDLDSTFETEERVLYELVDQISKFEGEIPFEMIENLLCFAKESLANRGLPLKERQYSDFSLSIILNEFAYDHSIDFISKKDWYDFYLENALRLGEKGNAKALRGLGYRLYESDGHFPMDQVLAGEILEKSFAIEQNSTVANTLGYIYYYGKTRSGDAEPSKAFRYFAFGEAFGNVESIYKLADCYLHGYGGLQSNKAAYSLVSSVEPEQYERFLSDSPNKYADIASRMGRYYHEGIGVEKNLEHAYFFYLLAREAIRRRMEKDDYIGDAYVSKRIQESIEAVRMESGEEEIYPTRDIVRGFYSIRDHQFRLLNCKFKITHVNGKRAMRIRVQSSKKGRQLILAIREFGYCRRKKSIDLLVEGIEGLPLDSIKEFEKKRNISIENDNGFFVISDRKASSEVFFSAKTIYLDEDEFPTLERAYAVVDASYPNSEKLYSFLCEDEDIEIGDTCIEEKRGQEILVKTKRLLYFDELPFPLKDFTKCVKKR